MPAFSSLSMAEGPTDWTSQPKEPQPINKVNAYNFNLVNYLTIKNYVIMHAIYPDCIGYNYEGRKILVFKDHPIEEISKLDYLEPHFLNNPRYVTPIARFDPSQEGILNAVMFCIWKTNSASDVKSGVYGITNELLKTKVLSFLEKNYNILNKHQGGK